MTQPPTQTVIAPDGIKLAFRRLDGVGDLIVAIHGFSGDGLTMLALTEACRDGRPALLVDVVGHGQSDSPAHLEHYSMTSVVDQVLSVIGPHEPMTVHLLGYSMGGRIALAMAARAPWYFASITTLSATPGIEDPVERATRYDKDQERALELEAQGMTSFFDAWLDQPLFASYVASLSPAELQATKEQRTSGNVQGLSNSLRGTGTGSMAPVWNSLSSVRSPVLTIAGSLDERYVAIARRVSEACPLGESEVIDNAGHVVHHENLPAVATRVTSFLAKCGSDARN